jgi:aminoglycoside phosphotransferase (APT) family kinase protein
MHTRQILEIFACLEAKLKRIAWGRPTLVHGDFSPNHIFVDASSTLTWIDFNTAHYGNPAEDLSAVVKWLNRGELFNHVQYFMAAYREASGSPGDDWDSAIDFFIKMRLVEKLGSRIVKQRTLVEGVKQRARTERLERLALEQDRIEQKLVELMDVA